MYEWTVNFYSRDTENVFNLAFTGSFSQLEARIIEIEQFLNSSATDNHHVSKYHIFCKVEERSDHSSRSTL